VSSQAREAAGEEVTLNASAHRFAALAVREFLLLALVAGAAFLFLNHGLLYFTGDTTPRSTRPEAYAVTTLVFYVFVRGAFLVLSLRPPRVQEGLVLCPECGQELDGSPEAVAAHVRAAPTTRPSERDIREAIALRKALDEAHRVETEGGLQRSEAFDALLRGTADGRPQDPRRSRDRDDSPGQP
jgi:hypothetical protein